MMSVLYSAYETVIRTSKHISNDEFSSPCRRSKTSNFTVWTHTGPCETVKFRFSSELLVFTEFQLSLTEENGVFEN
jgi:hypothetical protein